jgi:hypothetical protein
MPLVTLHNLLNVLVQLANKRGLTKLVFKNVFCHKGITKKEFFSLRPSDGSYFKVLVEFRCDSVMLLA